MDLGGLMMSKDLLPDTGFQPIVEVEIKKTDAGTVMFGSRIRGHWVRGAEEEYEVALDNIIEKLQEEKENNSVETSNKGDEPEFSSWEIISNSTREEDANFSTREISKFSTS